MSELSVPRPGAVTASVILLALEFGLLAVAVGYLVVELIVDVPTSLATAVALLVLVVIAAVWVAAVSVGVWRGSAWSRSAGVVWQILQFAVGIGAFQGALPQPAWGWPLVAASVVGVVLLLSKPVREWCQGSRGVVS